MMASFIVPNLPDGPSAADIEVWEATSQRITTSWRVMDAPNDELGVLPWSSDATVVFFSTVIRLVITRQVTIHLHNGYARKSISLAGTSHNGLKS